jgi:DNA-binding PadR family transcriptional regulator
MGDQPVLGEFEQLVVLAVLQLGDEAYGVPIRRLIEERAARKVSRGAVYTTLDRLEAKGVLASQFGDPTPEPSGKAKRFYAVEPRGIDALRRSRAAVRNLWDGLEELLGDA